jgi:inositol phosphorylceramide mannosyltransferase catalytic subunit
MQDKKKRDICLNQILGSKFFQDQRITNDFHLNWKDFNYWSWIINQYEIFLKKKCSKKIVPKKIHQIWIGGAVPKKYDKWRSSWEKKNPDYEYFLWDEKKILQLGLENHEEFVKTKQNIVKADIARYEILFKEGGIYVDTDFESLKKIKPQLLTFSFIAGQMTTNEPHINNAIIISEKNSKILKLIIDGMKNRKLPSKLDVMEVLKYYGVFYLTNIIKKNRKILNNIVIMPSQYFYPWPNLFLHNGHNRYSYVTRTSLAIHHWEVSWLRNSIYKRIFFKLKELLFFKIHEKFNK